jgi:hypothetical protein
LFKIIQNRKCRDKWLLICTSIQVLFNNILIRLNSFIYIISAIIIPKDKIPMKQCCILFMTYVLLTSWYALDESISCKSLWTSTSCSMISNQTDGSQATHSTRSTRIYALFVQTSLVQWAIRVEHTFRMTADWRVTFKTFQTCAHCSSSKHLTVCIDTTWAWVAWITRRWNCTHMYKLFKIECVPTLHFQPWHPSLFNKQDVAKHFLFTNIYPDLMKIL